MVFISYSEDDIFFVDLIRTKFEKEQIPVWVDQTNIKPGSDWSDEIQFAIGDSKVMLVILSPSSYGSTYITYEWSFALGKNICVIPILFGLDESLIHPRLSKLQYLSFTKANRPWGELINQIRLQMNSSKHKGDGELVKELIESSLRIVCQAMSTPSTPSLARLRAFTFIKDGDKLVCNKFWAPNKTEEKEGLVFEINDTTKNKIAVVRAALERQVIAAEVEPLPPSFEGIHGNIDKDLCFVLAAPIGSGKEVLGTVDFDASNEIGKQLLSTEVARTVLFELGQHIYMILKD
jgi:hypothetical protein